MKTNLTAKSMGQRLRACWQQWEEHEERFLRLFAPSLINGVLRVDVWDPAHFFDYQ
jgi:hypothetical protein